MFFLILLPPEPQSSGSDRWLQYKLDMIAKARLSGTEKPAAPRIEVATGSGVPV